MPSWTLAQLMSETTRALGNRGDLAQSDVSFWVNEAYEEVSQQLCFENESEAVAISSTTVNEDKIALPTDFRELVSVSNLSYNNVLLDPLNVDQLMKFDSDTSGIPRYYAQYADWLELRPLPDSAYSLELRYRKVRSDMTATTAQPTSVATRFRRGIMLKAKELMAQHVLSNPEKAVIAHNEYISFMHSLPTDTGLRMRNMHTAGMSLGRNRGEKVGNSSASFDRDSRW